MAAVEHLAGRDDIPEGVYVDACNALKELHSLTKLFRVTYNKFYVNHEEHETADRQTDRQTRRQADRHTVPGCVLAAEVVREQRTDRKEG